MKLLAMTASTADNMHFCRPRYANYILTAAQRYGFDILPVMLPITAPDPDLIAKIALQFDGFLFTGGNDIDPAVYGEEKSPACGFIEAERDLFELALAKELLRLDKPVFGICRGCQTLAVACGAKLVQDIPSMIEGGADHAPEHTHEVNVSGWIRDAAGESRVRTNSYHHQSVKNPPACLNITARTDDGVTEGFEHTSHRFYKAVQWHPELDPDDLSWPLIRSFLEETAKA